MVRYFKDKHREYMDKQEIIKEASYIEEIESLRMQKNGLMESQHKIILDFEATEKRLEAAEKVIDFYADEETDFTAGLELNKDHIEEGGFMAREYRKIYKSPLGDD